MSRHQFFWSCTRQTFCRVLGARYRTALEPGSDPEPDPPFIVVSNHGNFFDPWILGFFQHRALRIMMNDDGFRSGAATRWYLGEIGAFAKKKGAHDLAATKKTLSFLKSGEPVLIFPEGQATWDGATQPIYGGIERLVKRAGCPLVILRMRGNFLTRPWWAANPRRGRISIRRTVLSSERLRGMAPAEVLEAIRGGISHNDILDEQNRQVPFAGRGLAEGLGRLVWRCLGCGAEGALAMAGDAIRCRECGGEWRIDAHCRLWNADESPAPSPDLHAWVTAHRQAAREAIAAAGDDTLLAREQGVTLQREGPDGVFAEEGRGTLALTPATLSFEPDAGAGAALGFAVGDLENFVIQRKDLFEITARGIDYRFAMPGGSPMRWLIHLRYLRGFEAAERSGVI
ncbi:MAG TPA: 1-acyl-sn-glycerol-3-phosphate acyltransferase [Phycisphaerae bacterium]|nr:1-acyl-sn-glycerol-3-phosphate acyltransferase [Phycisphaerae bacterium]